MSQLKVTIAGAGIFGLWQALLLSRAGHAVRVLEKVPVPFAETASQYAGAMIAPYCEAESAEPIVRDFGLHAAGLWRNIYPRLIQNGTLVVAGARDQGELRRFQRMTVGHDVVNDARIAELEPDLGGRFHSGLFFPDEAHMATPEAMGDLLALARREGADFHFGVSWDGSLPAGSDVVIDCRGIGARGELKDLRGVRGERLLVRTNEVALLRPVRLLHPRHPLYVVPWGDGRFLVGATVIETNDPCPMTVRSALELLGLAYALHPAFGEAQVEEMSAGVRPAFPDNVPRVVVGDKSTIIRVNGAFRHGFLLAPVMAEVVAGFLQDDDFAHPLLLRRSG
jgi:glycine oxidase